METDVDELVLSLDRSRKRHRSAGLLRGDQVTDRLAIQEASASPLFKKKKASTMALTADDFRSILRNEVSTRLDSLDAGVSDVRGVITRLETSVGANAAKIAHNESNIAEIRKEIGKLREQKDAFPPLPCRAPLAGEVAGTAAIAPEAEAEFSKARRSLRLWPVPGSAGKQVWEAAGNFLKVKLGLGDKITEVMIEHISRPEIPSGPAVRDEVLVIFREVAVRDMVMGSSAMLAQCVDESGRPTAGVRLEVPPPLRTAFRVLYKFGQSLRSKYGQGTRRHIKFDDMERTLFLNARLPGDENWTRISLAVAKKGLRSRELLADDEVERRFDISGPFPQRPRARSEGQLSNGPTPMDTARPSAWTGARAGSTSGT